MTRLRLGQKVQIAYDPNDYTVKTNPATKYNGTVTTISRIRVLRYASTYSTYYELEGIESEWGIPYSFIGEQLFVIEE